MRSARATILGVLILLAGCDDPPCPTPEAAQKAAEAYRACISVTQTGTGGYGCGDRAYRTFCRKPD